MTTHHAASILARSALLAALTAVAALASAQPTLTDPGLRVSTVVTGVLQATGIAFIGANDFFVIEKASGRVQRVVNGGVTGAVFPPTPTSTCAYRGDTHGDVDVQGHR